MQGVGAEHGVLLPEPYRTLVAEISNGSALGLPEDGGLLPLGWQPHAWPYGDECDPSASFPLGEAWFWETDPAPSVQDSGDLIEAAFRRGFVLRGSGGIQDEWILVTPARYVAGLADVRVRRLSLREAGHADRRSARDRASRLDDLLVLSRRRIDPGGLRMAASI